MTADDDTSTSRFVRRLVRVVLQPLRPAILMTSHAPDSQLVDRRMADGRHLRVFPPSRNGVKGKSKGSPYSITKRRVPELMPVLGSQPAGDMSHKPGGRQPLLSARPAVTPATLKTTATNFVAW